MKKRMFSFVLVLVIAFSGVFSCFASADSSTSQKFFDMYKRYLRSIGEFIWDQSFFGQMEDLSELLGEQKDASDTSGDEDTSSMVYYAYDHKWYSMNLAGFAHDGSYEYLHDCSVFAIIDNFRNDFYSDRNNLCYASCIAVPSQYAKDVTYTFDGRTYSFFYPGTCTYYTYTLRLRLDDDDNPVTWCSSGPRQESDSNRFYWNTIDEPNSTYPYMGRKCGLNEFERSKLAFSGSISHRDQYIDLHLETNREILESVDGTFMIGAGILFDDGIDRMYAGEYIDFSNASSGHSWDWTFDLNGFSYYVYRKRCPLESYKAFIFVYQNEFVYDVEFPIELQPPGGIFDDIEDPPQWKDYHPEPSEEPTPPQFDYTVFFDYNSSNTTYQTFNFTSITNYHIGGAGGGNPGGDDSSSGSGDDSSSGSGDDSSSGSGEDPGGDSSSGSGGNSSGSDPGGGGGGSFNDWFSDAVVTINENVNGGLDTLNENIRIIKENTENYFTAVHDYIEGYFNDWLEYIAALLKKFKDDFNNWTDAFGNFLTDSFDTINRNIVIVGDNIVKAIKEQVVPDNDVVYDIASSRFPIIDQVKSVLSTHEVEQKDLIVSIPLFGSNSESNFSVRMQSQNSSGQLRDGEGSPVDNSPINTVSGDCLTFNLTTIFTQYDIPRFRYIGTFFILGSTLWSLLNITFKIFGLGFFGDVQAVGRFVE